MCLLYSQVVFVRLCKHRYIYAVVWLNAKLLLVLSADTCFLTASELFTFWFIKVLIWLGPRHVCAEAVGPGRRTGGQHWSHWNDWGN